MEIDPVEERTGDDLAIVLRLGGAATAFVFQIAKAAARTWMHCHFVTKLVGIGCPKDSITST